MTEPGDAGETHVSTPKGFVRVVLDWRGGTRRQRSYLEGTLLTDEEAAELGVPQFESMSKNTVIGRG